jgi:3-oxoacyl-[acyl-carrier-protein] synthase II
MKFAITGIGILNGLGDTVDENWQNLLAGKTAIQDITWPEDDPDVLPATHKGIEVHTCAPSPTPEFTKDQYENAHRYWAKSTKMGVYVADKAYRDSGQTSKNIGLAFSTTTGSFTVIGKGMKTLDQGRSKFSPRTILNSTIDYPCWQISQCLGLNGFSTSMHSACSTGVYLLDYAIKSLITDPDLDGVMIGGADSSFQSFVFFYFQNLNALSREPAATACKPFDINRSGIVIGEGAGAFMLEPLEKAVARGAHIYGLVLGTGLAGAGEYGTDPDPNGTTQKIAVHKALRMSGINAEDIDYINAHATGTVVGDDIEYELMNTLFPNKVMVSNKGQIGHSLGVSGVLETIYTTLALRDQRTPPNFNLTDPIGTGMQLPREATKIYAKYALKNSFAFAGRSACAVLAKYDGETE